jgi:hypothetical protein
MEKVTNDFEYASVTTGNHPYQRAIGLYTAITNNYYSNLGVEKLMLESS